MNCKQVENLLPLYVGRDLDARSEHRVMAHVESCATCSAAAAEYRQTRMMLQEFAPPVFSEDVYAGIRQNVWRRIESDSTGRSQWAAVIELFQPRLGWALAAVFVIAVSVFGIYFIANRLSVPPRIAGNLPVANPEDQAKEPPAPSSKERAPRPSKTSNAVTKSPLLADRHSTQRRTHRNVVSDRTDSVVVARSAPSLATETPTALDNSTQPDDSSDNNSKKTLRMEIQTKNPNIRIIWFAQRETRRVSPNSKGI